MNHIKKLFLPIICLLIFVPYGIGQNENPTKKNASIKPFYSVAANFGISTTSEIKYSVKRLGNLYQGFEIEDDNAKLSYKTLVYGVDLSGGIEFKHYFKVGLGLGYFYYKQDDKGLPYYNFHHYHILPGFITTHAIPLFLFLRSDFLDNKISPYIDMKIGNNFLITKEAVTLATPEGFLLVDAYGKFRLKNGLFLASNLGIAFKMKAKTTLNVSVGYRFVSRDYDSIMDIIDNDLIQNIIDMSDKRIEYRKTGYVFVDHQFLLNLGVSF